MQHVFSLGSVFRASPFVNYHHTPAMDDAPDAPPITTIPDAHNQKDQSPPPPPPPQQKLLIKLRVSDLSKQRNAEPEPDVDELLDDEDLGSPTPTPAPAPAKRRGGGAGSRGKRRKVEPGTPTSDGDASVSVSWDSASGANTPTKRGRGKGSRGGGRGRGGRKSGLQHQVLPAELSVPGTPDSLGELSLRPGSPSSTSTSLAPTPTPISTPTLTIPSNLLPLPPSSLSTPTVLTPVPPTPAPAEIDPALLATAPRRPLPTRAFPVQPAPKTTAAAATSAGTGADWSRRKVRKWGVAWREVKGVGGGSWWVRTWVGSNESEYASDPARILSVPSTLPRPTKPRKTDSSRTIPTIPPVPAIPTLNQTASALLIDVKPVIAPPVLLDGKPLPLPVPGEASIKDGTRSGSGSKEGHHRESESSGSHYREQYRDTRDTEGAELLAAFASSSAHRAAHRKPEPPVTTSRGEEGWSASVSVNGSSRGGSVGGIGGKHYRDEEGGWYKEKDRERHRDEREGERERGYYREREYEYAGSASGGGGGGSKRYYRDTSSKAEGSSAGSTPGPRPGSVVRETAEEVVGGAEDGWKGKGKEKATDTPNGKVEVNGSAKGKGKGKEEVVNGLAPVAGGVAGVVLAGDGRGRSGSGYEQAAQDVEMELMGEL